MKYKAPGDLREDTDEKGLREAWMFFWSFTSCCVSETVAIKCQIHFIVRKIQMSIKLYKPRLAPSWCFAPQYSRTLLTKDSFLSALYLVNDVLRKDRVTQPTDQLLLYTNVARL